MTHWLDDFPPLRVMRKRIAAVEYNRIRLGLLRERQTLHVPLKHIHCLYCILDRTAWICADECQGDVPILAWTNFKIARRNSLDEPIECELRLYHIHAGLVMGEALDALAEAVEEHCLSRSQERYSISEIKY